MAHIAGGCSLLNLLEGQLSFYGAIDEAVLYAQQSDADNADGVLRIVEAMLPHTTGFGQAGWYRELQQFGSRPGVRVGDSPINGVNFADELVLKMGKLEDVARLVRFEPDGGVLKAGRNNEFKLTISCAGIPSGIFLGKAEVFKTEDTQSIRTEKVTLNL